MKEELLLSKTLDILEHQSEKAAYDFLVAEKGELHECSSQVYNYLYCLAALSGKLDEALSWLGESIVEKGYWYRPEVFEDSDLDSIRDNKIFHEYQSVSHERYSSELSMASTVSTWKSIEGKNLFLVLHGNQQNISIAGEKWNFIESNENQVEYVQSCELDSYQLYRWEDDGTGPEQLMNAISSIEWHAYEKRTLCGFSSGCNVILSALANDSVHCDAVILQSPWIPVSRQMEDRIKEVLVEKNIKTLFICGENDEDCIEFRDFADKVKSSGADITAVYIEGLGHEYPKNFKDIVNRFLTVSFSI